MALPGFELLYSGVAQQIRSSDDAAIAAVHWNLISNGLKCCGSGESWPDQNQNIEGSEALPTDWNTDSTIYALRYVDPTSNRTYLMKALAMEGALMLHLLRVFDEKASSVTIRSRDFVNSDTSTVNKAFTNLSGLNSTLTQELYQAVLGSPGSTTTPGPSTSTKDRSKPERSPLEEPWRGSAPGAVPRPLRDPFGPAIPNPFAVGGDDLDPLRAGRGGGGGMYMDPRNFPRPGFGPGMPQGGFNPPGFPPGSVPPGARFDPVGPAGMRPNPDPDHERPPGYDDMFM